MAPPWNNPNGYPWQERKPLEAQLLAELIHEVDIGDRQALLTESTELLAIFTSIGRTAKRNKT